MLRIPFALLLELRGPNMRWILPLIMAVWLITPALAADELPHPIDTKFGTCVEADPSTAGMIGCASAAGTAWDAELNQAYKGLVGALTGRALDSLKQSQRGWITQRDKEFALQAALHAQLSGTMWGPVMADQRVTLIKTRALQLRAYAEILKEGRP
jgi:uncharacterized protein YecT (DUF1311 family)